MFTISAEELELILSMIGATSESDRLEMGFSLEDSKKLSKFYFESNPFTE